MIPLCPLCPTPQTALIVEDLPDAQEWLARALQASFPGIAIERADTLHGARQALSHSRRRSLSSSTWGCRMAVALSSSPSSVATRPPRSAWWSASTMTMPTSFLRCGRGTGLPAQRSAAEADRRALARHHRRSPTAVSRHCSQAAELLSGRDAAAERDPDATRDRGAYSHRQRHHPGGSARMLGLSTHTVCGHVKADLSQAQCLVAG